MSERTNFNVYIRKFEHGLSVAGGHDIIFLIFHKIFVDYNASLKIIGNRLEKIGGKIYCEFVNDWR